MSAIIVEGSMAHYEALGRGRPVIFLHDWVGSWRYWINAMQAASTSFRAYGLDLLGFGDTARAAEHYSIEEQAVFLERFLNEMGIGKIALVGHGLGALVGLEYMKTHYESVDRMMAISAPLRYDWLVPRMQTAPLPELIEWLIDDEEDDIASALSDASKADPQAVVDSLSALHADEEGVFPHIRKYGVPCLFVYGADDPVFVELPTQDQGEKKAASPTQEQDENKSLLRLPMHMHQINLDDVGHYPMLENVSQFNRLLVDFLALDSGVSPIELQMKEEWKRRVR
ncbi:MAG: alpha/beta hydrolase [Anaerolineales bacterium]|nr:alpha/beta hydrolase [Anaerolineales bacterium]